MQDNCEKEYPKLNAFDYAVFDSVLFNKENKTREEILQWWDETMKSRLK